MRVAHYSDTHCEFQHNWVIPQNLDADIIALAGDITTFERIDRLSLMLQHWDGPVVYAVGNHEYYGGVPMSTGMRAFKIQMAKSLPNVHVLDNESVIINGISFFGGTMWTDLGTISERHTRIIERGLADFTRVRDDDGEYLTADTFIRLHGIFRAKLISWLDETSGPKIILTHHAPATDPSTRFLNSPLNPAFCCTDMTEIIRKYRPDFWIYGHTHEIGDWTIEQTRLVSNPLGYRSGVKFEVDGFDPYGRTFEIDST